MAKRDVAVLDQQQVVTLSPLVIGIENFDIEPCPYHSSKHLVPSISRWVAGCHRKTPQLVNEFGHERMSWLGRYSFKTITVAALHLHRYTIEGESTFSGKMQPLYRI